MSVANDLTQSIDQKRVRAYRLNRTRQLLSAYKIDAAVLFDPLNCWKRVNKHFLLVLNTYLRCLSKRLARQYITVLFLRLTQSNMGFHTDFSQH